MNKPPQDGAEKTDDPNEQYVVTSAAGESSMCYVYDYYYCYYSLVVLVYWSIGYYTVYTYTCIYLYSSTTDELQSIVVGSKFECSN